MKKSIYILASLFMLLLTSPVFAQADPGIGDPGEPAAAPIDNYIWALAIIGLFFVFIKIKSIQKKLNPK